MSFHNALFPTDVSYGTSGGPGFNTAIIATSADVEQRIPRRDIPRRSWNASYGVKSPAQVAAVRSFYIARRGAAYSFKYKDFSEFSTASNHTGAPSSSDVLLGTIPSGGAPYTFQLRKAFTDNGTTVYQDLTKIEAGTVVVEVNGTPLASGFSVDENTGVLTITSGQTIGHSVRAGCQYYHHARFAQPVDALLSIEIEDFETRNIPDIPIIEVLGESAVDTERVFGGAQSIAATDQLSLSVGTAFYSINPDLAPAGGTKAILPNPASLFAGGPYFLIKNTGIVDNVTVEYPANTTLLTLSPGDHAFCYIGINSSPAQYWEVF